MIVRRWWVRIDWSYFGQTPSPDSDVIEFIQHPDPATDRSCNVFHSLVIRLDDEPQAIFSRFRKTTRNEIRAAEREGVTTARDWATRAGMDRIISSFNSLTAAERRIARGEADHLQRFADQHGIFSSSASDSKGRELVRHIYICANSRARLRHSATAAGQKQTAGRANRLLHWQDIRHLQECGFIFYDLGGWYPGTTDSKLLAINHFKESFGGRRESTYSWSAAITWKGHLFLAARRVRSLLRS